MKTIPLTHGYFAQVDDEDYEELIKYKWFYNTHKSKNTHYARRIFTISKNKRQTISMHRQILKAEKGQIVDHRDRNGLNNQKDNLRICSNIENVRNSRSRIGTSKYKGVSLMSCVKRGRMYSYWSAIITINYKHKFLGTFKTEEEAAMVYNEAAKTYFGEFALLNEI